MTIDIAIVDDHPLVRSALCHFFEGCEDICVVGEGANANDALTLTKLHAIKVLVLDLGLPGRSGLDAIVTLRRQAPSVRIVVFSGFPVEQYAVKIFKMGGLAFVPKSNPPEDLVRAIRAAACGRRWILPGQAELMLSAKIDRRTHAHDSLTIREFQVLLKLARGMQREEAARQLALSIKSISTHTTQLYKKLDVHSASQLTHYALKHRLLD